jgi:hypothetical protein
MKFSKLNVLAHFLVCFETGSHYAAQATLELAIFLPQLPECWMPHFLKWIILCQADAHLCLMKILFLSLPFFPFFSLSFKHS